ncbi:lipoprotein-releasing system permease protein [Aquimarina sp. MAR_2010_214]|uniref:ABC transporter permease n=1 Tax=Aquimarina sp. MAR_2010_214 TaxID=1250026 RepID=UPI000C708EF7|nr:FtsX-like permease family protein [Aquimarina sp. MAR_2010_214]PKV48530.1 lipoprotein-releasing system permease protein [Aquimarina sp. MAR_2010_214]
MNFSYYIAKRYLFSPGSSNAINIITIIAAAGVVIGAMALFIVLSGFAGLKDFSLQFSSYFDPDLKIFPSSGKTFTFTDTQKGKLAKLDGVAHFSEIVEERVFLEFMDKQKMSYIKGVDANYHNVIHADSILVLGDWLTNNDFQIVAGNGISRELSMGIESTYTNLLSIYVPKPGKGIPSDPSKAFRSEKAVNIGVYSVNEELDKKYIFATTGLVRKLLELPEDKVTHIELKLSPQANEEVVIHGLQQIFDNNVIVKNRVQLNDTLYKMLNTENLVSYLVITLIAIIALFNVAGAIIMMIIDKRSNVKTLYNVGASLPSIRKIFLFQGSLMTVLGTVLGLLLGFILIVLQQQFGLLMITPSLPYPTRITMISFVVVFFTITIIGFIASLLASSRINQKLVN